jgi:hypothetical protein
LIPFDPSDPWFIHLKEETTDHTDETDRCEQAVALAGRDHSKARLFRAFCGSP